MDQQTQDQPVRLIYRRRANNAKLDPANDKDLYKKIFNAARLRLTQEEAAAVLGVACSNFRAFLKADEEAANAWADGKEVCKVSLKRTLFDHAKSDPTTARYLANNILGMSNDPSKNKALENQGATAAAMNREEAIKRITELQQKVIDITPAEPKKVAGRSE